MSYFGSTWDTYLRRGGGVGDLRRRGGGAGEGERRLLVGGGEGLLLRLPLKQENTADWVHGICDNRHIRLPSSHTDLKDGNGHYLFHSNVFCQDTQEHYQRNNNRKLSLLFVSKGEILLCEIFVSGPTNTCPGSWCVTFWIAHGSHHLTALLCNLQAYQNHQEANQKRHPRFLG